MVSAGGLIGGEGCWWRLIGRDGFWVAGVVMEGWWWQGVLSVVVSADLSGGGVRVQVW